MEEKTCETASRRAKCLAYLILVCTTVGFAHELGRQRAYAEARDEIADRENLYASENERLRGELTQLRGATGPRAAAW
jgi:hypothetical protein